LPTLTATAWKTWPSSLTAAIRSATPTITKYTVSDPYYSFFGYGNPSNTVTFGRADPNHSHDLLIIFGAGSDAWHAATPKAKFVVINVPFDEINVGRMLIKKGKPPIYVIKAVESRTMDDSAVFWDAKKKKWRWQPA